MPNLLRTEANERIDLTDWEFTNRTAIDAQGRITPWAVLTKPTGAQRTWILSGFDMSNPPLTQSVQINRGVAILAQRSEGEIRYGSVAAEGATSRAIDIQSFPDATYSIYLRFEYIDSESQNRIFWDPSGLGNEYAKSLETRRIAEWSVRIEAGSPGPEWLKIGEVVKSLGGLTITDMRPFYFEGPTNGSYASGWSTDGGGSANDRNANRAAYGVGDFQTFTAAMRQCLEDVKGRGLRRWWARDIGGMNVGFDAQPVEKRLAVGDVDFSAYHTAPGAASAPEIQFYGTNNRLLFDRSTLQYRFRISNTEHFRLSTSGVAIEKGLYVGNVAAVVTDNEIEAQGAIKAGGYVYAGGQRVYLGPFGSDDYVEWTNVNWDWWINGVNEMRLNSSGLAIDNGLYVGSVAGTPINNEIIADGAIKSGTYFYAGGNRYYMGAVGTDDYVSWSGTNWDWILNAVTEMRLTGSGLAVANGLYVGSATGTPTDNEVIAEGYIRSLPAGGGRFYGASDGYLYYDTTSPGYWNLIVANEESLKIRRGGFFLGRPAVNSAVMPFDVSPQWGQTLSSTTGVVANMFAFGGLSNNEDRIWACMQRLSTGSSWDTAATFLYRKVDATYMSFLWLGPYAAGLGYRNSTSVGGGPTFYVNNYRCYAAGIVSMNNSAQVTQSGGYGAPANNEELRSANVQNQIAAWGYVTSGGVLAAHYNIASITSGSGLYLLQHDTFLDGGINIAPCVATANAATFGVGYYGVQTYSMSDVAFHLEPYVVFGSGSFGLSFIRMAGTPSL